MSTAFPPVHAPLRGAEVPTSRPAPPPKKSGLLQGWSLHIGTVAGIAIRLHATLLILFAWVLFAHVMQGSAAAETLAGLAYVAAVFAIIVLHELGHALTARHFGIRTRDITLLPIGGVARIERMPDEPRQELLIALAGPAVNFVLALGIFVVLMLMSMTWGLGAVHLVGGPFLVKLMWTNVGLAVFNLIPAFPMDGGRVLRAALASRMPHVRATDIAARVGQWMALLFGLIGLFFSPILLFVALFVWMGAQAEASAAHFKAALSGVPVGAAMATQIETLDASEPLSRAVDRIVGGFQQDFPVVYQGALVGVLTRSDVLEGLAQRGPSTPIGAVMHERFAVADAWEMIDVALPRLEESGCPSMPVVHDGHIVGLLTLDAVGDLLGLRSAMMSRRA